MPPRQIDLAHRWRLMPSRASLRSNGRGGGWRALILRVTIETELEACAACGLVRVTVITRGVVENREEFYYSGLAYAAFSKQPVRHCELAALPPDYS